MQVVAENPEEMNLLGLMMRQALEDRMPYLEGMGQEGDVAITADRMSVTISFSPQQILVRKGVVGSPRAHLKSSLEALISVARGRFGAAVASREVRVSGDPRALLPLAGVFRRSRPRGS